MRKQKKGFAFVLDILVCLFIVFNALSISNFYFSNPIEEQKINVNQLNRATDIIKILNEKGVISGNLDIIDHFDVAKEVNALLENNYKMYIEIKRYNLETLEECEQTFKINTAEMDYNTFPDDIETLSGGNYNYVDYVNDELKLFTVDYYIWFNPKKVPYCGDGIIDEGENCDGEEDCPSDCHAVWGVG